MRIIQDYNNEFNNYKTSTYKSSNHFVYLFVGSMLLIFVIAFSFAVYSSSSNDKKYENSIETTAVISSITYTTNHDGDRSYTVYVEYNVDDINYEVRLNYYTSSMRVGDNISIRYLEENPRDAVSSASLNFFTTIFSIILICFIIGLLIDCYLFTKAIRKSMKAYELVNTGNKRILTISGYEINRNVKINHRNPCNLICYDDFNEEYFLSNKYFLNYHKFEVGTKINIYFDPNDANCFYVDTKNYFKNN